MRFFSLQGNLSTLPAVFLYAFYSYGFAIAMTASTDCSPALNTLNTGATIRADIAARLREHGIEPTRQRVDIAQCLLVRHRHLSADQLQAELTRQARHAPSRATIYNTLRLLADHGLVREVVVDPHRVFFDSNIEAHHHYYDSENGELIDIPAARIQLAALPPLPLGATLEAVEVVFRIRRT